MAWILFVAGLVSAFGLSIISVGLGQSHDAREAKGFTILWIVFFLMTGLIFAAAVAA